MVPLDGEAGVFLNSGNSKAKAYFEAHRVEVIMDQQLTTAGFKTFPEATVVAWIKEEAFQKKKVMNNASESEGGPPDSWYQNVLDFLRMGTFPKDPLIANKI
ncbi:hypothetical protein LIER_12663 [Lithospermum erythrorhizon]|uniref:Uncharacterized protein n=1 Tax=Lithospermum erythrorhizon TaxID=34254 RepID=A0AAV3PVP7_LITER